MGGERRQHTRRGTMNDYRIRPHPITVRLQALISRYSPDEAELDLAMKRADELGAMLANSDFGVQRWELGGSCQKRTAIHPVNDVDLFVYLDEEYWTDSWGQRCPPDEFLRAFVDRIEYAKRYHVRKGNISIRPQNRSLRVIYHREGSIQIDVVPAIWRNRNSQRLADIPDVNSGTWISTCVTRQANLLFKLDNQYHPLRRAIRLLKLWKRHHKLERLRSYVLELLAMHARDNGAALFDIGIFMSVLRRIVDYHLQEPIVIPDVIKQYDCPADLVVIMDVGVKGNNVASNINFQERQRIVATARRTLEYIDRAYSAFDHGHEQAAFIALQQAVGR